MDIAVVTPRLPPPKTAAKKSAVSVLGMVAALAVGGAAGFLSVRHGFDLLLPVPGPKLLKLVSVAALPLVWFVVVAVHEFGHLAGGWLIGGRFLMWVVGPIAVRRTPAGIKLAWNRNVNVSGGLAACLPLDASRLTPRRVAVMILGGPVASLALTTVMLFAAAGLASGDLPGAPRALAQHVALFTAGLSGLIFLGTAAPFFAGGFKSDGRRALDLLRGDRRSEQEGALVQLTMAGLAGVRPADYDPGLVARAQALGDGSLFDIYAQLTIYYHAADRGDWTDAQTRLDRVVASEERIVPFVRDVVRCEYAWLLATQSSEVAAARAWLDSAGRIDFDPATRLRAEAAVLLAEGRSADAAEKARAGLDALEHKSLSPVKSPFAVDALESLVRAASVDATARPAQM